MFDVVTTENVWLACGALMLLGILGCFVPVLPGPPLVMAGALLFGSTMGWDKVSTLTWFVLGLLTLVGATADLWMGYFGARRGGASPWASVASIIGGIVGVLVLSLPGAILGSLGAIVLVEWNRHRDWSKVLHAGGGYLVGWILAAVVEFFVCLLMIALFVLDARA